MQSKNHRISLVAFILLLSFNAIAAEKTDTLKQKESTLKEVVVEGQSQTMAKDRNIYRPTARQKDTAADGIDLITRMALPDVYVDMESNTIKTVAGNDVSIFIDYIPADNAQLEQMRTQDVNKVEVYEYPRDPRFNGSRYVVNYVMKKYETGGYTKLKGIQSFMYNFGNYSINSKLVYKKMTYDIAIGDNYYNTGGTNTSSHNVYEFTGGKVTQVQTPDHSRNRNNKTFLTLRLLYSNKKMVIQNNLGFNLTPVQKSDALYHNCTAYPGGLLTDTTYADQRSRDRNLSPVWKGNYQFFLPYRWTLTVNPGLSYTHIKSDYNYNESGTGIVNNVREDLWYGSLSSRADKQLGKHSVFADVYGDFKHDKLDYMGTVPSHVLMRTQLMSAAVGGFLDMGPVSLQLNARISSKWENYNSTRHHTTDPRFFMTANWLMSPKNRMSLSIEHSMWTLPLAQMSPNVVIRNLFDAISGNASLKSFAVTTLNLQYSVFPIKNVSGTVFGTYQYMDKPATNVYNPTVLDGRELMLRSIENLGYRNDLTYGVSVSARLFNNQLSVFGRLQGEYSSYRAMTRTSLNNLSFTGNASYYFGNFFLFAAVTTRRKTAMPDGYMTTPTTYNIDLGWAKNSLNLRISARNPFTYSKPSRDTSIFTTYYVSQTMRHSDTYRRYFYVSATYSFSYGKKVKKTADLQSLQGAESGILN